MKETKMSLEDYLSAIEQTLENGEEIKGKKPLSEGILNLTRELIKSNNEEEIKKGLTSLNNFIKKESKLDHSQELMIEIKNSLKVVFDVSRVVLGQPSSDKATNKENSREVMNKVLEGDLELSSSLFNNMINNNFRKNLNEDNVVDLDISAMLYMGHFQNKLGEETLINSPVVNAIFKRPETIESMAPTLPKKGTGAESLINGFKGFESLMCISKEINSHLKKHANKDDKLTLETLKNMELALKNTSKEEFEKLDDSQKEEYNNHKKYFFDYIQKKNLKYDSDHNLNEGLQNKANKDGATIQAAIEKDETQKAKAEELNAQQIVYDSIARNRMDFYRKNNMKIVNYKNFLDSDNHDYGSNKNIFSSSLISSNNSGFYQATLATFSPITGMATLSPKSQTNSINLTAVIYQLMERQKLKSGEEFHLHLGFNGNKLLGSAYMECAIDTALSMTPPVSVDNIHVPKKYQHILDARKENRAVLSNEEIDPSINKDKNLDNDDELNDLNKALKVENDKPSNKETLIDESLAKKELNSSLKENEKNDEPQFPPSLPNKPVTHFKRNG